MNHPTAHSLIFGPLAFILLAVTLVGLVSLAAAPAQTASLTLAYAAGLSMILLPCTLPALLVIVPLSMGKGYARGVLIALFFSLGMAITLTAYGVAVAALGKVLYLDHVTMAMWLVGGLMAYVFGLSELGLLSYKGPAYADPLPSVMAGSPTEYSKVFLLGLLLGNAGIGCPNPAFYVLLTYMAGTGDPLTGGVLGLVHGLGRATPLLAFSLLAILGVNALGWLKKKREALQHLIGWGLIVLTQPMILKPLFGHAWWEESVIHKVWNKAVLVLAGPTIAESADVERQLGDVPVHDPFLLYGPWVVFALFIVVPILWRYGKSLTRKEAGLHVETAD